MHLEADHLRGRLPERAACWFCDDVLFDSCNGDKHWNLDRRMWHIYSHLDDGERGPRRSDYWMLDHVREHELAD